MCPFFQGARREVSATCLLKGAKAVIRGRVLVTPDHKACWSTEGAGPSQAFHTLPAHLIQLHQRGLCVEGGLWLGKNVG